MTYWIQTTLTSITIFVLTSAAPTSTGCNDYGDYNYDSTSAPCPVKCIGPSITNGKLYDSTGGLRTEYDIGDVVTVRCERDYTVSGPSQATCQDNQQWSWGTTTPQCVLMAPNCTTLKPLSGAMFLQGTPQTTDNGRVYLRMTVQCQAYYMKFEYKLQGDGVFTCVGTTWTGNSHCQPLALCPRLRPIANGRSIVAVSLDTRNPGRNPGDVVHFQCNTDFVREGPADRKCLTTLQWTNFDPVCERDQGIAGIAKNIRENIIEKYKPGTSTAEGRGRLSASNPKGIDLFFLLDRSSSISNPDFKRALDFVTVLVDVFGISSRGGATRLALITFGNHSKVELSFESIREMEDCIIKKAKQGIDISQTSGSWSNDCLQAISPAQDGDLVDVGDCEPQVAFNAIPGVNITIVREALKVLVKRLIGSLKGQGGGTNIGEAIHDLLEIKVRCGAESAVFLMSDGRDNYQSGKLEAMAASIREQRVDEFFSIGIGRDVAMDQLKAVSSKPSRRYVFNLASFGELSELKEKILTSKTDFTACGVSAAQRNQEVVLNATIVQEAKPFSWPWLVKISINQGMMMCGGALVAPDFVLTSASCLFNKATKQRYPKIDLKVEVGYYDEGNKGDTQLADVLDIYLYSKFKINKPRVHDVALLKIQEVTLGRNVRTVCVPRQAPGSLMHMAENIWLVGWNTSYSSAMFTFIPYERTMDYVLKSQCRKTQPYITDSTALECMGDSHYKRGNCAADRGAPVVIPGKDDGGKLIYSMVALVQDGSECMEREHYTVITVLDMYLPWINQKLDS